MLNNLGILLFVYAKAREATLFKKYLNDFFWVIGFIVLFILLKTTVVSFYLVPSTSMLPNITTGDRILLNKLSYGLWLPFSEKPLFNWSHPRRGDIVLFKPPLENAVFVKRVIGIAGDKVSFHKGIVLINDQQLSYSYLGNNPNPIIYQNSLMREENRDLQLSPHLILMSDVPSHTYLEQRTFIVPPQKVFVLGDNRDSSIDSRVFGFIDEDTLYGEAVFVLFSTTGNQSFFPEFRTERFFKSID